MLSKNQIKAIINLHQKKYRLNEQLFFVEGEKGVRELLGSHLKLNHLYFTEAVFTDINISNKTFISNDELKKISALSTPNNCLAIFEIEKEKPIQNHGLQLALDDIRDPGNLGTIIRLCDWFGIKQLLCSKDTVEVYNPKVVQATMGSLTRVQINYVDLESVLAKSKLPIFGTFMDSASIYDCELPREGIIVMGNEANGISDKITKIINKKITIPRFGDIQQTESLNVATAAAIILSEFRRK